MILRTEEVIQLLKFLDTRKSVKCLEIGTILGTGGYARMTHLLMMEDEGHIRDETDSGVYIAEIHQWQGEYKDFKWTLDMDELKEVIEYGED